MLNTAIFMGRLTADPELRHTSSDTAVTSFTVAADRSYVKTGAERQADFIDVVAWRSTAEFICKYFKKGQLIAVQGSIQTLSLIHISTASVCGKSDRANRLDTVLYCNY